MDQRPDLHAPADPGAVAAADLGQTAAENLVTGAGMNSFLTFGLLRSDPVCGLSVLSSEALSVLLWFCTYGYSVVCEDEVSYSYPRFML